MMCEAPFRPDILGEPKRRRWFTDDFFDLFVWYTDADEVLVFQLCYDKCGDEHALTCRRDAGYTHRRVDDGGRTRRQATPWLLPDGSFDSTAVLARFLEASREIDADIAALVAEKLAAYGSA